MKKNRGFTLIEFLLVIFIVGIIAALAIPNIREYTKKSCLIEVDRETSWHQVRHLHGPPSAVKFETEDGDKTMLHNVRLYVYDSDYCPMRSYHRKAENYKPRPRIKGPLE